MFIMTHHSKRFSNGKWQLAFHNSFDSVWAFSSVSCLLNPAIVSIIPTSSILNVKMTPLALLPLCQVFILCVLTWLSGALPGIYSLCTDLTLGGFARYLFSVYWPDSQGLCQVFILCVLTWLSGALPGIYSLCTDLTLRGSPDTALLSQIIMIERGQQVIFCHHAIWWPGNQHGLTSPWW
jgi:hypothetical protein